MNSCYFQEGISQRIQKWAYEDGWGVRELLLHRSFFSTLNNQTFVAPIELKPFGSRLFTFTNPSNFHKKLIEIAFKFHVR